MTQSTQRKNAKSQIGK